MCLSIPFSLSLIPMRGAFEDLRASRALGAAEAGNGTGLFQVLGHHLQNAGHLIWHRHTACLQNLPFESITWNR